MLLRIQDYDVTIKYIPGKELAIPDALSRLPSNNKHQIELDISVNLIQFSTRRLETIKTQIDHDTTLSDLRSTIIKGWPANRRSVNPCIRHYWAMRDLLSVEDGIVLMSERVIIPLPSRKSILETIHSGHQGITKNQLLAKTTVYWPNINQDIDNFVNNCEVCQQALPSQPHEPLHQHPIPERAWQVLGTDVFNWNNKDFLNNC